MHVDVVIIGAGMSGLAAGIRLAYFDKRVCIVERHHACGGLNSYYCKDGRPFDVGLHALTNYVPPDVHGAPLNKLLRQLRLSRDEFALCEQWFSEIRFPGRCLRFTNDVDVLIQQVAETFPHRIDRFRSLLSVLREYEDTRLDMPYRSARKVLGESLDDPVLIDMLLCPVMYYGSAEQHDMDFTQFVTIFKSLFLEGLARPRGGVRTIIRALVKKYCACGGVLKMRSGVRSIDVEGGLARGVTLESGERLTADIVFSSAGLFETLHLVSDAAEAPSGDEVGQLSFVESIAVLDASPAALGHEAAIVFFNDSERFTYARPEGPVDLRSGVICCPGNYAGHEKAAEGLFRMTNLANHEHWMNVDETTYVRRKEACRADLRRKAVDCIPDFADHVVYEDMFTPRTVRKYTGHINGAVYGAHRKIRDGRTRIKNLFICGTDQGFLGIIGSLLSGITMANLHVLAED